MKDKERTEKRRLQKLAWRDKNPEKVREQKRKWYQHNKETVHISKQKYYKNNREKIIEHNLKSLKIKKETIPGFREAHNQYVKSWNEKYRREFLDMYGNRCVCCGEDTYEFLTLEHKLGQKGQKKEKPSTAYRKATLEYRPDLYEILCMNCNHAKGMRGYCPHEKKK